MRIFPLLMGLLSGLLFGLSTPLSKLLLEGCNSFQVAGLLYLGAALAFLPHVLRKGGAELRAFAAGGKRLPLAGIVLCGGVLGPLLLMTGLKAANASSVSVWLNLELVATACLGFLFFKDHLDGRAWLGVLLTLLAGLLVALRERQGGLLAGGLVAAACLCWAVDNHLTALMDGISAETVTFVKGLAGGMTNFAIGCAVAGGLPAPADAAWALLIGVFSYGVSIVLYVTSAQNLGATRSQILFSTGPFWGILAALLFLGERIEPLVFAAMALLAGGIALSSSDRHVHLHHHAAFIHTHLHRHDDLHHGHSHPGGDPPPGTWHSHEHRHEETDHSHPHYPDLHHRHGHEDKSA